ncbi:hypothetical protein CSUI_004931 [Cystoisospora suis]|uniref:Transmembrane protein n=1 Tax=Cystoisospora suis TaxID=483139 RepID=A0A2C6KZB9_9APIC|nr:hypothetical protein CSUI_004931 [Cystoisospora suis]
MGMKVLCFKMLATLCRAVCLAGALARASVYVEGAFSNTNSATSFYGFDFVDPVQFFSRSLPLAPASVVSEGFLSPTIHTDMLRSLTDHYNMAAALPEQFVRAAADAATYLTMKQRERSQSSSPKATHGSSHLAADEPATSPSRFFIPGMPFYPANWMPAKSLFPLAQGPNDWFMNFLFVLWAAFHPSETALYVALAKGDKYQGWNYQSDGSYSHSSENFSHENHPY